MNGKARAPTSTPCVSLLLGHRPLCGVHLSHHALSPVGACLYPPYTVRRTGTLKTGAGIWPSLNLWNSPKTHQPSVFLWTSLPILGRNGSRSPISSCIALMPHVLVVGLCHKPYPLGMQALPQKLGLCPVDDRIMVFAACPVLAFSVVLRSPIYSIVLGPEMSTDASTESHLCMEGSEFQCRRSIDEPPYLPVGTWILMSSPAVDTRRQSWVGNLFDSSYGMDRFALASRAMIYVVDKSKQPAWAYETSSMQGATTRSFGIIILGAIDAIAQNTENGGAGFTKASLVSRPLGKGLSPTNHSGVVKW
eukprot:Gb_18123 [translate_table: standard]